MTTESEEDRMEESDDRVATESDDRVATESDDSVTESDDGITESDDGITESDEESKHGVEAVDKSESEVEAVDKSESEVEAVDKGKGEVEAIDKSESEVEAVDKGKDEVDKGKDEVDKSKDETVPSERVMRGYDAVSAKDRAKDRVSMLCHHRVRGATGVGDLEAHVASDSEASREEESSSCSGVTSSTETGVDLSSSVAAPSFVPAPPSFVPAPPTALDPPNSPARPMKPPFDELPLPPSDSTNTEPAAPSSFCKALANFNRTNAPNHFGARQDLLSLRVGDILVMTDKLNDNWSLGQLGEQLGLFPTLLVADVDEREVKRFIAQSMHKRPAASKESRQELQQKMKELSTIADETDQRILALNEQINQLTTEAHHRRKKLRAKLSVEYKNLLPSSYYDISPYEYISHAMQDLLLTILAIKDMDHRSKTSLAAFVEASTEFGREFKKHLLLDPKTKGSLDNAMASVQYVQKCLLDELSNSPTELLDQSVSVLSKFFILFQRAAPCADPLRVDATPSASSPSE